jgi:hypothetical protein
MPYILRDAEGQISRVSVRALPGAEALPHAHPDVVAFLAEKGQDPAKVASALAELKQSDADMARAIEDVIMALLKKNLLKMTDLPKPVQDRMTNRTRLRVMIQDAYEQASGNGHSYSNSAMGSMPVSSAEIGA